MDMDIKKVDRNQLKAFLRFDLMLLPVLIRVLYVLGSIVIILGGLAYPFWHASGMKVTMDGIRTSFDFGAFAIGILISAVMTVLWLVSLRIICESSLILFKIHEALVPKKPEEPKTPGPELAAAKPPEAPKADTPPPPATA
jgi:hypothetical protein